MKTAFTKVFIFSIVFILFALTLFSQSKYGKDSIRCIRNLSLYTEFEKQKNYDDALPYWRIAFRECPRSIKNIYIDGVKMYQSLINKEKDPDNKEKLIDTLLMIYDRRIENFGEKGNVLSRKAIDLLRYRRQDINAVKEGYGYFTESIALRKEKSSAATLITYMTTTVTLFRGEKLTKEDVIQNYATAIDIVDARLKKKPDDKLFNTAKKNIEELFEKSSTATCEDLISLFTPRCNENPNDIELLKKVTHLLDKTKCTDSQLFYEASESLYKLEPSAFSAYNLAVMSRNKKDYKKAAKYFKQAIELETDNKLIARYYIELGDITYRKLGNFSVARSYAYKAIETDETSGHPYLLIGNIYVSCNGCGEDDFERKAVYWIAVDKYKKAKLVDPALSEEADKYISIYARHFPDNETIFFYGYEEGDIFEINYCWINEKTIVRSK